MPSFKNVRVHLVIKNQIINVYYKTLYELLLLIVISMLNYKHLTKKKLSKSILCE